MKLFEYEAKQLLAKYGVEVPPSVLVRRGDDVRSKMLEAGLEPPVVVKAQVLVAGRGKAGGIKLARSIDEAVEVAEKLFETPIKGVIPRLLLIEKAVEHDAELYTAIVIDRSERKPVILASRFGGMDIEEIAREKPESIVRRLIDPYVGLRQYEARMIGKKIGLTGKALASYAKFLQALYRLFTEYDGELAESNPIAVVEDSVIPLDARLIVDDNSLYRHPELGGERIEESGEYTEWEVKARKAGLTFVELDGNIGIISNGAGLTMTTMDLVLEYGGRPANFLDIGGGARADLVKKAVGFLLEYPKAEKIFINIFGGITRGDEVAKGIVAALRDLGEIGKPIVVRLAGTNEEEGRKILSEAGIEAYTDPIEAVKKVMQM
ncbi:MAG: ADP-forming succinate--CoA ligase subunit beta [Desulfurococcales archaeon]|nr:ADP-forming succinate--CoA ligase subunit beta [Desulfurococcales archaeon]